MAVSQPLDQASSGQVSDNESDTDTVSSCTCYVGGSILMKANLQIPWTAPASGKECFVGMHSFVQLVSAQAFEESGYVECGLTESVLWELGGSIDYREWKLGGRDCRFHQASKARTTLDQRMP